MPYNLCDQIWAGPYPDRSTIEGVIAKGVTSFVNLTRKDEKLFYGIRSYKPLLPPGVKYQRFPLWTPWLPEFGALLGIVRVIESWAPVYFHCRHGLDRTGVTAMLVLMNRGMTMDEALQHLYQARSAAGERISSPRKPLHFAYLRKAERIMRLRNIGVREEVSDMPTGEVLELSVENLVADIRDGLKDSELMTRYGLETEELRDAFVQLVKGGWITQAELEGRKGKGAVIRIVRNRGMDMPTGLREQSEANPAEGPGSLFPRQIEIRAERTRQLKDGIDRALRDGADRIVVTHRRAKRAHRAVTGIRELTPDKLGRLAAAIATGNLVTIGTILVSFGVGPLKLNAIRQVGFKRSYDLARYYRETKYVESSKHSERVCVLEGDR